MKKPPAMFKSAAIPLFLWLALFSISAHAAIDNAGVLDTVLTRYQAAASTWGSAISARATWLFWVLATISMVWTFGMMALRKADIAEFFAEFIRFTVTTGFFWWLLSNGPVMATGIMDSLRTIAANASGNPTTLTPSGIVDIGFDIFFKALDQSSVWSPVDSACGILISAVVLVVLALVAVNMLILLVSGWILAYAGIFILGFGGAKWTSEMAIGYFKSVLGVALQLMTMVLLVGIGKSFVDQYYTAMSAGISLKELGVMLIVAVVLLALVNKVPPLIDGLSDGHIHALGNDFGAGAAIGAAAVGGAAVATAGAALAAGATSMAGGAQALMAAFSKANASESGGGGSSGTGDLMAAAGGVGGGGGDSGGGSSLASAMGDSGGGSAPMGGSSSGGGSSSSTDGGSEAAGSPSGGSSGSGAGSGSATAEAGPQGGASAGSDAKRAGDTGGAPGEVKSAGSRAAAASAAGAAAAKVGRVAAGTAGNLAQGSWDVAKAKASSMKDVAMDRISETTGGKIAVAINARADAEAAGKDSGGASATFDNNSLSAGTETSADAESEVAAFRDRDTKTS
ncbi:P-type conjugative transfer protein TrbL [Collimonas sp.]|jgi:type IV secretion system protein TrbL|uniref:P-type conjugative transfer protein TrbL n=1 Tax=Collimonas sp. TaxID=1963772 RepID=UPI0037BEB00A